MHKRWRPPLRTHAQWRLPAEATRPIGGGKIFLAASEKKMINLYNREPTKRSLPRLCVHLALKRAAESHSQDVTRRNYSPHNTKG